MSGLVLLIIGLASLGLVLAAFVFLGVRAWRVYRHGMAVYDRVGPLADQLSGWSAVVEAKAQRLADNGAEISANLERLQASLARFQVIAQALSDSMAPVRRVRRYLGVDAFGL
jgi:hypothetical protein